MLQEQKQIASSFTRSPQLVIVAIHVESFHRRTLQSNRSNIKSYVGSDPFSLLMQLSELERLKTRGMLRHQSQNPFRINHPQSLHNFLSIRARRAFTHHDIYVNGFRKYNIFLLNLFLLRNLIC